MDNIIKILTSIFFLFTIDRFMKVAFEIRKTPFYLYFLSCLFYTVFILILSIFIGISYVTLAGNIIALLIITLNFDASWVRRIAAVFFIYIFMFFAEFASISIMAISLGFRHEEITSGQIEILPFVPVVTIQLFMFLGALLAQNLKNLRRETPLSALFWISSLFIPIASIYIIILMYDSTELNQVSSTLAVTALFAINILAFYLRDSLSAAYAERLETKLLAQEKDYYYNQCELMRESTDELQAFRHDIKNHLSTIKYSINHNRPEEAAAHIITLIGNTETPGNFSKTGNIAFDSIINYKLRNIDEENIAVNVDVAIPQHLNIEVSDTVKIMGNILDNALNAVLTAEEKKINLKVKFSKGRLIINLENTFDGVIKYENNKLVPLIDDGKHGYGLKNVQSSVEKYNGVIEMTHTGSVFIIDILLYIPAV